MLAVTQPKHTQLSLIQPAPSPAQVAFGQSFTEAF